MELEHYFPVWEKLTPAQQERLKGSAAIRTVKKGSALHSSMDCTGLLLIWNIFLIVHGWPPLLDLQPV